MSRTRERFIDRSYPYIIKYEGYPDSVYDRSIRVKSESITDNNNGSSRPESDVTHTRAYHFPHILPDNTYFGGTISGDTSHTHANIIREFLSQHVVSVSQKQFDKLLYRFYNQNASLIERGETLNFLNELRELPSMFKSLNKYSYLDWEFGWSPFLRDLTTILSKTESTLESIKGKINSSSQSQPFEKTSEVSADLDLEDAGLAVGFQKRLVFKGQVTIRMHGKYRIAYPDITDAGNLRRLMLDIEGFNPDPATIWEAVPFSWMVDWFLPIGDSLKALSGSNFNPKLYMRGTISTRCSGTYEVFDMYDGGENSAVKPGGSSGGGSFSYYRRVNLSEDLDSNFLIAPEWRLPVPDLRKAGILNDIFGKGSSLDDVNRLRRQSRRSSRQRNGQNRKR